MSYAYGGNLLQRVTDTRGGRTLYCYDSGGRMISYYLPTEGTGTKGNGVENSYDIRSNSTRNCFIPKTAGGLSRLQHR